MSHDETAHVSQQRVQLPANQKSTGVSRVLPNPISAGVFCEEPRALKANV
jgi:hypothetical protein